MIFYNRRTNNPDLVEIKDQLIVNNVRKNLKLKKDEDHDTPIICGSIINGGFHNHLKMLRGDVFSVFSVC